MASRGNADGRHDVVVIGAGPAGEAAAELGGSLGYSVALVERDVVGGTVVTSGGAPTKTFREAASTSAPSRRRRSTGSPCPHRRR
jgi:pyruvate/2-oxoglutarate dehydrogenase complex dihydrolipoamide dehydrogenase (E3) component